MDDLAKFLDMADCTLSKLQDLKHEHCLLLKELLSEQTHEQKKSEQEQA
jgi:hypothetical protein